MEFGLIKKSYVRDRLTEEPYMGTQHLGKRTESCLPNRRRALQTIRDRRRLDEPTLHE